jgi:ribosome biogenesis protein BRX1
MPVLTKEPKKKQQFIQVSTITSAGAGADSDDMLNEELDEDDQSSSDEEDQQESNSSKRKASGGRQAMLDSLYKKHKKSSDPSSADEEEDVEDEETAEQDQIEEDQEQDLAQKEVPLKNKQRVLILSSRGITSRYRHLLQDLHALLPHSKKDSKLDLKTKLDTLNELAELANCNNCVYFDVRKHTDLFLWISKTPNGPCAKFHIQNVHTMDELKLTGNCLKGSRPLLSFDASFDAEPHTRLMKELLTQVST